MNVLLLADKKDQSFYSAAKNIIEYASVFIPKVHYNMLTPIVHSCKKNSITCIVTCSSTILKLLLKQQGISSEGDVQQWAGAKLHYEGIDFIITRSFKQIVTTPTGAHIFRRHVNKHLLQAFNFPKMRYSVIEPNTPAAASIVDKFSKAKLIAVDIETKRQPWSEIRMEAAERAGKPLAGITAMMPITDSGKKLYCCCPMMTMVGYYAVYENEDGTLDGEAIVLRIKSMDSIYLMRKLNNLAPPKITQNGGYEATYFIRYGAPLHNWLYDTFHFMHSWLVELPRTLDFLSGYFLPNFQYWKDLITVDDAYYNAIDTYSTAWIWVSMMLEAPEWAFKNYSIEFRKCFPNICMGLEGLQVDQEQRQKLLTETLDEEERILKRLQTIIPNYNPNSSQQTVKIMNALCILARLRFKSSDKNNMTKWREVHPLNTLIADLIKSYREYSKQRSFLTSRLMDGRFLYELNAGGTLTGRSASKASNLWVGSNIQNQKGNLRMQYKADEGWVLCSVDGSQAESRTTAYISQDENLMDTVETAEDFHKRNASLFFGIPESKISKAVRTVSKRTNHGANYNMTAPKLVEVMGHKAVMEAGRLLGLPSIWSANKIATHLLEVFDTTYPDVRGRYYDEIINQVKATKKLTGPTGWTRYCFGTPSRTKSGKKHLNEYAAHPSQSLSVMMVDDAVYDFWYEYQIKRNIVRMKAQVHDEGLFQVRPEHKDVAMKAFSELMARPVEVHGRTLIIPNDGGSSAIYWGELKD